MNYNIGTYYIQRISKFGQVTNDKILDAIVNSKHIKTKKNTKFAFTESKEYSEFIFSILTKYHPEDEVNVVDEISSSQIERKSQAIKNHIKAGSPFIYIPSKSIIAHLHVWNEIKPETFSKQFIELYYAKNGDFFAQLVFEPLVDLKIFLSKLQEMTNIKKIKSKIYPSNPHFSKYWAKLDSYLKSRNVDEMIISEESKDASLNTPLVTISKQIVEKDSKLNIYELNHIEISVLMAVDGYGNSEIQGMREEAEETIYTKSNYYTFKFEKEPDPLKLYSKVMSIIEKVENERGFSDE